MSDEPSDWVLTAYVFDELTPEVKRTIEARLQAEPLLVARIASIRKAVEATRAAYEGDLEPTHELPRSQLIRLVTPGRPPEPVTEAVSSDPTEPGADGAALREQAVARRPLETGLPVAAASPTMEPPRLGRWRRVALIGLGIGLGTVLFSSGLMIGLFAAKDHETTRVATVPTPLFVTLVEKAPSVSREPAAPVAPVVRTAPPFAVRIRAAQDVVLMTSGGLLEGGRGEWVLGRLPAKPEGVTVRADRLGFSFGLSAPDADGIPTLSLSACPPPVTHDSASEAVPSTTAAATPPAPATAEKTTAKAPVPATPVPAKPRNNAAPAAVAPPAAVEAASNVGTLVATAQPWAKLSINGRPYGTTPMTISLPAGTHTVTMTKGSRVVTKSVSLLPGERAWVESDFQ